MNAINAYRRQAALAEERLAQQPPVGKKQSGSGRSGAMTSQPRKGQTQTGQTTDKSGSPVAAVSNKKRSSRAAGKAPAADKKTGTPISPQQAEAMVLEHASLVKRIAYHLSGRLPNTVQIEDLIQAGMIGLIEASRNFDDSQGASFETYAGIRIRGAMIDEVRRNGWAPRSVHRKSREALEAARVVEAREGREAHDREVADELGITMEEYGKILAEASNHKLLSLEDDSNGSVMQIEAEATATTDPQMAVHLEKYREALLVAVEHLPEREQLVMSLYYDEEMNLREIGEVLGVSESRVCQIHGAAIIKLQKHMSQWH